MRRNSIFLLLLATFLVVGCRVNSIKQEDFSGEWIVKKATFKGADMVMIPEKIQIMLRDYKDKATVFFKLTDSTVLFRDMYAEQLPFKWKVSDDKMTLAFDSVKFMDDILAPLDSMHTLVLLKHDPNLTKTYNFKRDSTLKQSSMTSLKLPSAMYAGTYNIVVNNAGVILTSPTTKFELVNFSYAIQKNMEKIVPRSDSLKDWRKQ